MNVIKLDTEKKEGRNRIAFYAPNNLEKGKDNQASNQNTKQKRLSSATKARIEQKQLVQQMLLKSSSHSSNQAKPTGRKISSASSAFSSPRRELVKSKFSDRPKSATPRGRPKIHFGKPNG